MKPPSQTDHCRDPFEDTLDAIVSGDATSRDQVILNDTLRCDPEARRHYIRTMAFEAMLAREFAPVSESQIATAPRRISWLMATAIAASVILAATFAWRIYPGTTPLSASHDAPVDVDGEITHAVITTLDDAVGHFGKTALSNGLRLTEGLLELDHGLIEITFDTGAEVTLQGPASLQVESENKTRLTAGRASTYCPEQARGFVMLTPSSYIRDLGTAFSVEVRDGRETDLHVLEGEVEVAATGRNGTNPPKILRQREAVRLAAGNMQPINFLPENPGERRKRPASKIPPSVHWSFDEWDQNTTVDSTRGYLLTLQKNNKKTQPDILDGPFGTALHFDGRGTFATSDYPGIGGAQARTLACWLRIQPNDSPSDRAPNGIIAWGSGRWAGKWQLASNRDDSQGTAGAPRVEFGDGYVVASTDLRDGRWHHLAVVYLGGPKADVATHVRIYVDGKLETISGRRQRKIDTDTTSTVAKPLTLGRHIGNPRGQSPFLFDGDLDEVHIFEGPLLPNQIVRLMKRNSVQPPKP